MKGHHKHFVDIKTGVEREEKILFTDMYKAMEKGKNQLLFYHLSAAVRMLYLSTSPLIGLMTGKE